MKQCKYTALIWAPLLLALSLPGGMWNLKLFIQWIHGNTANSWCTLFWEELPAMIKQDVHLSSIIETALQQKQNPNCVEKRPIIGTNNRIWGAQLEYHRVFPGAKILNLEQNSSNFYLWRDNWADYANCTILFIGEEGKGTASELVNILTVKNQYSLHGFDGYPKLHLQVASGMLKDRDTIQNLQKDLLAHPRY